MGWEALSPEVFLAEVARGDPRASTDLAGLELSVLSAAWLDDPEEVLEGPDELGDCPEGPEEAPEDSEDPEDPESLGDPEALGDLKEESEAKLDPEPLEDPDPDPSETGSLPVTS